MKHFILFAATTALLIITSLVWTACSDENDDIRRVRDALEGTWKTERVPSADPYAVVQHVFTFTKDTSGIPGALSHYTMTDILADGTEKVTDKGTAGHPNGSKYNVWILHDTRKGGDKEVTVVFLNKERTQMRFESKYYIVKDVFFKQ